MKPDNLFTRILTCVAYTYFGFYIIPEILDCSQPFTILWWQIPTILIIVFFWLWLLIRVIEAEAEYYKNKKDKK